MSQAKPEFIVEATLTFHLGGVHEEDSCSTWRQNYKTQEECESPINLTEHLAQNQLL